MVRCRFSNIRTEVLKMLKYALAAALALGVVTSSSQAAPVTTASSAALRSAAGEATDVTTVASRRCWWRDGHKHCRSIDGPVASRTSGYRTGDYYPQDASKLPVGSQRWWTVKEREGSAGRP
jgi:hypothetical protein